VIWNDSGGEGVLKGCGDNESSKFVCPYLDDVGVVKESLTTLETQVQCQCRCRM